MELFRIDPGLAIWTWVTFGIMFMILGRFAFPTLLQNIRNREETIAQAVQNASEIQRRLLDIEKEKDAMIQETRAHVNDLLRDARHQAEMVRQDLLKKAEQEANDLLNEAKVKIGQERVAALQALKADLADFVCDTSEKVIGKSFVAEHDRRWVHELVETL